MGEKITVKDIDLLFVETFSHIKDNTRNIRMYTGVFGYDLFTESVDKWLGYSRIYLGYKIPRILRKLKNKIFTSASGRLYKRIKQ